jgi:transposase
LAWVEQGLAPILRAGELVILDNLATHKIRGVRKAIEARGAGLLYLPPYSPDFNPIEPMGSKIKPVLRSHAPRGDQQLLLAVKAAFPSISPADCRGFFFSAKYATSFMESLGQQPVQRCRNPRGGTGRKPALLLGVYEFLLRALYPPQDLSCLLAT